MTKQEAILILKNEQECIKSKCDRDCEKCALAKEEYEILEALDKAIYALSDYA